MRNQASQSRRCYVFNRFSYCSTRVDTSCSHIYGINRIAAKQTAVHMKARIMTCCNHWYTIDRHCGGKVVMKLCAEHCVLSVSKVHSLIFRYLCRLGPLGTDHDLDSRNQIDNPLWCMPAQCGQQPLQLLSPDICLLSSAVSG